MNYIERFSSYRSVSTRSLNYQTIPFVRYREITVVRSEIHKKGIRKLYTQNLYFLNAKPGVHAGTTRP